MKKIRDLRERGSAANAKRSVLIKMCSKDDARAVRKRIVAPVNMAEVEENKICAMLISSLIFNSMTTKRKRIAIAPT
jgi:hypothetical protein